MDNDTYDDRTSRLRDEVCKENDQINIKFLKQQEFNANIVKRLESIEDFREQTLIRLNQEIENRTKAFELIEDLQDDIRMIKEYSIDDLKESLRELEYNTDIKLERIEEILVVHRNQDRAQKKNYKALRDVWDKTVLKIIEKGEHGKG